LSDCPASFKIRNRKEQGYISKLWGSLAGQNEDNAVVASLPIPIMTRSVLDSHYEGCAWGDGVPLTARSDVYIFVVGPGSYVECQGVAHL
jgi:hypothetical protein